MGLVSGWSTSQPSGSDSAWDEELPVPARLATLTAWLTLAASLALTAGAWHVAQREIDLAAQQHFDDRVAGVDTAVLARMQAQKQVLRGGLALFHAATDVSREEWHLYVKTLELEKTYPGILGVGFAQQIERPDLEKHVRKVQAEGFSDYAVRPSGERAEYTPIVYLEPFDWRNQRAFGFDMFTEPVRREAMEAARDSGRPAVSGKVTLAQETERDVQAGFLMYLPLYRHGAVPRTPEQRREALQGYVFSPFRMRDLMAGILGQPLPDVRLRIYDGAAPGEDDLMYDSHPAGASEISPAAARPRFANTHVIHIEGHAWTLEITSLPGFESGFSSQKAHFILMAGILISLLMFVVVWSLVTLRRRATALARQMTEVLRESREQFRAVAETAGDAIISSDSSGAVSYFNGSAEKLFGYSRQEVLGKPLTIFMPERLRPVHVAAFERFLATGAGSLIGHTVEMTARRRDGSEFPIEISVASWATNEGAFFTAILRDISQRVESQARIRQLNSELHRQVSQLAEVNQELESFSYSVSHDLRAPLRAINGFARILDEEHGHSLGPDARRLLGIIRDNSRKMGLLIDDLLAFARLGQSPLARSRVDMVRLAREVVDEICQAGDGREADFRISALPTALGDRSLLRQVWTNLLTNAAKFSRPRQQPRIEAGGLIGDGEQIYFVRDNGVGFDMAHASQLFGVFQRFHRIDQFPGTGVGLAIVHRIITKHGGRVWAESRVDEGAVFYFSLPEIDGTD